MTLLLVLLMRMKLAYSSIWRLGTARLVNTRLVFFGPFVLTLRAKERAA